MFQNSKDFYASIEIASMVYLSSNNCLDITFFMIEDSFIWKLYVIKIEDRKNSKEKHANDVVLRVKWAREFMFTKRNKKKNPNDQSFLVIFFWFNNISCLSDCIMKQTKPKTPIEILRSPFIKSRIFTKDNYKIENTD